MIYDKIIFLDIDGVLNLYREEHDKYGQLFHDNFVNNLKHIIDETGAKIVLSSTWRLSGFKTNKNMWLDRKLPGELVDVTPIFHNKIRGEEIKHWLVNNQVNSYVIIDDDTDFLSEQNPFLLEQVKI